MLTRYSERGTDVEKALGVAPPETISIDPERPLYEACRRMLESRARRIPLVTNDSQTDRSHVLSVITQYRILKFVAVNVGDTQKLRRPLGELLIGTYDNIATASMDTPVIDVIHILVERSISSVPILNSEGMWNCSAGLPGTILMVLLSRCCVQCV
jgi:CBS domain-containing protein